MAWRCRSGPQFELARDGRKEAIARPTPVAMVFTPPAARGRARSQRTDSDYTSLRYARSTGTRVHCVRHHIEASNTVAPADIKAPLHLHTMYTTYTKAEMAGRALGKPLFPGGR